MVSTSAAHRVWTNASLRGIIISILHHPDFLAPATFAKGHGDKNRSLASVMTVDQDTFVDVVKRIYKLAGGFEMPRVVSGDEKEEEPVTAPTGAGQTATDGATAGSAGAEQPKAAAKKKLGTLIEYMEVTGASESRLKLYRNAVRTWYQAHAVASHSEVDYAKLSQDYPSSTSIITTFILPINEESITPSSVSLHATRKLPGDSFAEGDFLMVVRVAENATDLAFLTDELFALRGIEGDRPEPGAEEPARKLRVTHMELDEHVLPLPTVLRFLDSGLPCLDFSSIKALWLSETTFTWPEIIALVKKHPHLKELGFAVEETSSLENLSELARACPNLMELGITPATGPCWPILLSDAMDTILPLLPDLHLLWIPFNPTIPPPDHIANFSFLNLPIPPKWPQLLNLRLFLVGSAQEQITGLEVNLWLLSLVGDACGVRAEPIGRVHDTGYGEADNFSFAISSDREKVLRWKAEGTAVMGSCRPAGWREVTPALKI